MFLTIIMTNGIPIIIQTASAQIPKNNPNIGICPNIKRTSKNLLLLGNPRQRLNWKLIWEAAQIIFYLVPTVLHLKYKIL